jgi:hypothetical protein
LPEVPVRNNFYVIRIPIQGIIFVVDSPPLQALGRCLAIIQRGGAMRLRRKKKVEKEESEEEVIESIRSNLVESIISILLKIIGESVKDKLLRAVLVGVLSAFSQYTVDISVDSVKKEPVILTTPRLDDEDNKAPE